MLVGRFLKSVVVACCFAGAAASPALGFEGRCLIKVEGRTYLQGPCNIEMQKGGSFTVGVGETARSRYFAYVNIEAPNSARGYWNGPDAEDRAHDDLGMLAKKGGCWENERARVCAWRR